jgi:triacylglycerol esterase/lipase EstA (alpha/beta hydrolase family)
LFVARLHQIGTTDGYVAAEPGVVARVGAPLGTSGPVVSDFDLGDAVSANGQIVFWADTSAGERIVTAQEPRRPMFVVPGIAGSYAADLSNDLAWLMNRGSPPEEIQIDPIIHAYDDQILSLQRAGYVLDRDLFVAVYDWRLHPGPLDGLSPDGMSYDESKIDGHVDGLTADSITDANYEYGVDYFGHFLRKATESWAVRHPGVPLEKVDVVAHSTGGLVTRTYIQSDAYTGTFHSSALGRDLTLPKVGQFFSLAVPHRGASKAWNPLHDNSPSTTTSSCFYRRCSIASRWSWNGAER